MKKQALIQPHDRTAEDADTKAEILTTIALQKSMGPQGNDENVSAENGSREPDPNDQANISPSDSEARPAAVELLRHQLMMSVPFGFDPKKQASLRNGALQLYNSLQPEDAIDTILARIIVGLNNASMDCFDRLTISGNIKARDINLRNGNRCIACLIDAIGLYETRRRIRKIDADRRATDEKSDRHTDEKSVKSSIRGDLKKVA